MPNNTTPKNNTNKSVYDLMRFTILTLLAAASFVHGHFDPVEIVCKINNERAKLKAPLLALVPDVSKASQEQSEYMASIGKVTVISADGSTLFDRLKKRNYIAKATEELTDVNADPHHFVDRILSTSYSSVTNASYTGVGLAMSKKKVNGNNYYAFDLFDDGVERAPLDCSDFSP